MILTCVRRLAPYRLAGSALPSEFGGSERRRKKAIKFLYSKNKNKEMTHTKKAVSACFVAKEKYRKRKPSPLVGEGGGVSRRKGQV